MIYLAPFSGRIRHASFVEASLKVPKMTRPPQMPRAPVSMVSQEVIATLTASTNVASFFQCLLNGWEAFGPTPMGKGDGLY